MRVLIVGAGAVGLVFAHHLQRGGHEVAVYIRRPAQPDEPPRLLYDLRRRDPWRRPLSLEPTQVIVEGQRIDGPGWEQVFFCVPSEALREGLVERLRPHLASATVVKLQPGLNDLPWFTRCVPEAQVVSGMVAFVSYRAPLASEPDVPPGYAFWMPPLTSLPFSGIEARRGEVVATLRGGGLPARSHPDVETLTAFLLALQAPLSAGFACAGGSLRAMQAGRWMPVALEAARQARRIVSRYLGQEPPLFLRLAGYRVLPRLLAELPPLLPFPLEPFLAAHYGKLRRQSRLHLKDYIQCGSSLQLPTRSLEQLAEELESGVPSGSGASAADVDLGATPEVQGASDHSSHPAGSQDQRSSG